MVGRTVGKYRIVDQIGRGGMGTVYGAIDETLDRRVAIKVLNADLIDQDAVERFRREAMTLARLNHGRIGAIHELTRDGHDLLMVMEFLEGETFEKLIERGPLPIPRAVSLVMQILDALQYAHAAGVVHRDLKPANVILSPSGEIKVMDFGIARVQGSEHLTTSGFMVGTPAYMAPEQVRGEEVDPRMDLYSVTVVLYRMLTQRLPFRGDTAIAMIHSQLTNMPTPPSQYRADLPEWLVRVLDRGLAKVPADRFQSAAEFRAALEGGLTGRLPVPTGVISGDDVTVGPLQTPPSAQIPGPPATSSSPVASPYASSSAQAPLSAVSPAPTGTLPAAPMPPSAPAPPTRAEATVTLRAPHLATAGILLVLLVIGVGALAFIALRRPGTVVAPPAEQQTSADASAPDAAGAADPAAEPAPNGAPGTNGAPSAAAAVAAAAPTVRPAAAASATGATTPAGSTGPAATGRASATPATGAARGTSGGPAASGAPSSALATTAAPPTPSNAGSAASALPAAASAPAENFGDIKALVVDGGKSREIDALLSLEPGNLIVRSRVDGSVLRTLPYSAIGAATYARGRRPRGQAAPDVVGVPDNLGGSGLLGGARHWLTLQAPSEFLIVRLEDRNVIRVLNSIEARTGVKVQRNQSD